MSETDDDVVPNSFHKLPHENAVIHTQLPKSSYGSYTNIMTSNFNMPHRFMGSDQSSVYSRRESSPMSLRSFPNSRVPYQQSYPQIAMSSCGSVINARCRSPMSVRSNYSNTTVSAADIAFALKNYKFNKYDERMIHAAFTAFKKSRMRKRIGKRKNLKSFLKYCRRNSGGESGAEGSVSSVSSDDCRSTRSAFYTRNIPKVRARSPRIDLNKFTSQVRDNDNYTDCTENIKHNSFRNLITAQSTIVNHRYNRLPDITETHKGQCSELQNAPVLTLKGCLASLLHAIHRFNMSNANPTYEISYKVKSKAARQKEFSSNNQFEESDNESEEIFGPSTSRVNQTLSKTLQQKRVLETESDSYPESTRKKLMTSPVKQNKSSSSKSMKKITTNTKDFNSKKPLLPVRKFGTLVRDNEPEVLIAKSPQPLDGNVESLSNPYKEMPQVSYKVKSKAARQKEFSSNNQFEESDNESEEIFGPSTSRVNQTLSKTLQQKRVLETESDSYPESTRKKLMTSPVKQNKSSSSKSMKKITTNTKDFNSKKPLLPVRKFGTLVRDNEPEVLIAKSPQPLDGNVESLSNPYKEMPQVVFTSKEKSDTNKQTNQALQNHFDSINNNTVADKTHNSTVSTKPSFTKRKLFTQKLNIVENNNISSDNLGVNIPQTKALRACREKNKVRKLTSQSCLSRDISDNILPPDQIKNQTLNNTNVANKETGKHGDQVKGQNKVLETESVSYPESKRKTLMTSPVKQNKSSSSKSMKKITTNTKNFNSKKPLLPVRKFGTLVRDNEPEVMITKSSQPLDGNVESLSNPYKEMPQVVFTSKVTNSSDNLGVNIPQTKALRACRKKNKVRKLTSQSCLSRDISDNILPPDQIKNQTMNNTNVANKETGKHGDQVKGQNKVLETESVSYPESKRKTLMTSPVKQNKSSSSKSMKKITTNTKNFNSKKPLLPVRKFGTLVRDNEPEVMITKSSQPLDGNVESLSNPYKEMPQVVFTSKVTNSSDNLGVNIPQTKALRACREKNKVRKLTSQSCLSRDISDNILPPDQIKNQTMNNTNVANKETGKHGDQVKGQNKVLETSILKVREKR